MPTTLKLLLVTVLSLLCHDWVSCRKEDPHAVSARRRDELALPVRNFTATIRRSRKHDYISLLMDSLVGPNSGYNPKIVPASGVEDVGPMVVHCRLYLIRVQDLKENDETVVLTARLQLGWDDLALQWNPEEYGGVHELLLAPGQIWSPDLQIANSVEDVLNLVHDDDFKFRVTHKGRVWFHPGGRFATRCSLHLTYYPFDTQRCALVVESVTELAHELLLIVRPGKSTAVALGMYAENTMWSLVDAEGYSALYQTGSRTVFSRINFYFILDRKPGYFVRTFLVPLILLSVLQLLTYAMPIKYIDRVPQATVVLLTSFFFQGILSEQLPRTSDSEAFIVSYINVMLGLSVVTVSICIVTTELVDPDDGLPLWGILHFYMLRWKNKKERRNAVKSRSKLPVLRSEEPEPPPMSATPATPSGKNRRESSAIGSPLAATFATTRMYRKYYSPQTAKLTKSTLIAALINWSGFLLTTIISVLHPLVAFAGFLYYEPPSLPTSFNATKVSYYGEFNP